MALTQVVLQDIKKSSQYVHLVIKIYGISPDSLWISTTVTALVFKNIFLQLISSLAQFVESSLLQKVKIIKTLFDIYNYYVI